MEFGFFDGAERGEPNSVGMVEIYKIFAMQGEHHHLQSIHAIRFATEKCSPHSSSLIFVIGSQCVSDGE